MNDSIQLSKDDARQSDCLIAWLTQSKAANMFSRLSSVIMSPICYLQKSDDTRNIAVIVRENVGLYNKAKNVKSHFFGS